MQRALFIISVSILITSAAIYFLGRYVIGILSDDMGDIFLWSGGISLFVFIFSVVGKQQVNVRRGINIVALIVILTLLIFGLWGLFSSQGKHEFSGMAALLPFYSLLTSGIVLLFTVIVNLIWRYRRPAKA